MVSSNFSTIVYCCYLDFLLMRITKVTTRTGDEGQTGLGNGERVSKNSLRVNAMGSVDKLNSILGWARVEANQQSDKPLEENEVAEIPKCEANIFFNAICMSIGWRTKKLLYYLTLLSDFNVILFSIHDKYFTCEHIEMYGRFSLSLIHI